MSLATKRLRGHLAPVSAVLNRPVEWALSGLEHRLAGPARPNPRELQLTCVYLQWDPVEAPRELDALSDRLRSLPELTVTIVLVDNRSPGALTARNANATFVVGGDNRAWEFSGLQTGVDAARERGVVTDVWLLANDRYRADGRPFLQCLTTATIMTGYKIGGIVGHIDAYPRSVESFGKTIHRWVTSSFFLLSDQALRRSEPLVTVDAEDVEAILDPSDHAVFPPDGPVGARHADYLLAWLTGMGRTDLTTRWYGAARTGQLDPAVLRRKLQSILNEQLFSAKALSSGIPLVPIEAAYRLGLLGLHHPAVQQGIDGIMSRPADHPLLRGSRAARLRLALQVGSGSR